MFSSYHKVCDLQVIMTRATFSTTFMYMWMQSFYVRFYWPNVAAKEEVSRTVVPQGQVVFVYKDTGIQQYQLLSCMNL